MEHIESIANYITSVTEYNFQSVNLLHAAWPTLSAFEKVRSNPVLEKQNVTFT